MVGGVSIGAFMGALWCSERDIVTMTQKAREWSKVITFLLFLKIFFLILKNQNVCDEIICLNKNSQKML